MRYFSEYIFSDEPMDELDGWDDKPVAVQVKPAEPDWKAVVNLALDEALAIITLIREEREEGKSNETVGMALLERAELYRYALQETIDKGW